MNKILLHSCCAPCLTSTSEILSNDYEVVPFWFNPNIEPEEEHGKRLEAFEHFCELKQYKPKIIDDYQTDNNTWHKFVEGLEQEPEGGARCEKCIRFRLEKTAQFAKGKGFKIFATTLSVSPHKNDEMINRIGEEVAKKYGVEYFTANFKKDGGYARSVELSKEYGLYRQKYCGCRYSVNS